ncbi:MAG TPA: tRNA (adenosine(37)-N6)-dimethylallyltransferase MiaA [Enterovirga sp.]|nr:tRNA (adenosine(37)-N6)-dimethylallyltransferase MiaA [Enterovirga sp.]
MGIDAILIAGPTASGKSELALRLAETLGGAVVNADSMQVYRDLRILTARPSPEEEARAPHRLYGHIDGAVNYSAGLYVADAGALLERLRQDRILPIVVGGTGLYFKALTEGLSDMPPVPDAVRAEIRAWAEGRPTPELHASLAARDPVGAERLRPSDRQRILRALEFHAATGKPLSAYQAARVPGPLHARRLAKIFVAPERAELRARIDGRFVAMMEAGALDEVAALAGRGLDPALPVMRAHGVPGLLAHLRGEISLDEAVARGQADTRAYVKRQFTWGRHQMPDFLPVEPERAFAAAMELVAQ